MRPLGLFLPSIIVLSLIGCGDGVECGPGTTEVDGACVASERGGDGQPCYGNGTCDGDLECRDGRCEEVELVQGEEGGACYPNGTCNAGLECAVNVCRPITCTPDCTGRVCGGDGCGGSCGPNCAAWQSCSGGQCENLGCIPLHTGCPGAGTQPDCCTGGGAYNAACQGTESEPNDLRCCVGHRGDCRTSADCCDPYTCQTYIDGLGNLQERCLPE